MSNIFIISAPSGCGKTSLVRELCQTYSFLEQTVSYTTRTIRSGEVDGLDYHFISKDEFIDNKKNDKFIIWIIKFLMATMMYYLDYF